MKVTLPRTMVLKVADYLESDIGELDLFGEVPQGAQPGVRGVGPKGGKHYTVPRGYVMPPGSGPAGETCGSCKHMAGRGGRYRKCRLAESKWTHGPATDVLARSPACSKWEVQP